MSLGYSKERQIWFFSAGEDIIDPLIGHYTPSKLEGSSHLQDEMPT
jgi:hypothetical protein